MDHDSTVREDKHITEITHLIGQPVQLAGRAAVDHAPHQAVVAAGQELDRPRARHRVRYSITITNSPGRRRVADVRSSHHAQSIYVQYLELSSV